MTMTVLYWALVALALVGASFVVFGRDVTRLALGLGAFLLAAAGLFALFGFGFLSLAEIFVYVGGVLVLVLFAIMLVHRAEPGKPSLTSRHEPAAALACVGIFGFVVLALRPLAPRLADASSAVDALGSVLLGKMLVHFELAGSLLLVALVAVVSVSGGDD